MAVSPELLSPEEERCGRTGPQKLSVARFKSHTATNQAGIRSFLPKKLQKLGEGGVHFMKSLSVLRVEAR